MVGRPAKKKRNKKSFIGNMIDYKSKKRKNEIERGFTETVEMFSTTHAVQ